MIDSLSLYNFRNIERAKLEFSPCVNVITGANGSGKTSIFEGAYFCGFGVSPFSAFVDDVIKEGNDMARLSAGCQFGQVGISLVRGGKSVPV